MTILLALVKRGAILSFHAKATAEIGRRRSPSKMHCAPRDSIPAVRCHLPCDGFFLRGRRPLVHRTKSDFRSLSSDDHLDGEPQRCIRHTSVPWSRPQPTTARTVAPQSALYD